MRILMIVLMYITILGQLFSIQIPFLDAIVFGYTIRFLLYYAFIFISLVLWLGKCIYKRYISKRDLGLIVFILGPFLVGIIEGWGFSNIIIESTLFLMPVAVYAYCSMLKMSTKEFTFLFLITTIVGSVLSVLVALRVIRTSIWAAEGMLVRAAGAIDSTLFVGGYIISLVMLFMSEDSKSIKESAFYLISYLASICGLMFSESRMRILLVLALTIMFCCFNLLYKKSKFGNARFLIIVILILLIVSAYQPDLLIQSINQVVNRFSVFGSSDGNILYRGRESSYQMQLFYTSPILGLGWGSRSLNEQMYAHNIFTTLLMQCGLVFSTFFAFWFMSFFKNTIRLAKCVSVNHDTIICSSILFALVILGFTNAGIIQSGGYFMMTYVFLYEQQYLK